MSATIYEAPANTFFNPDTNYGSNFAWTNPANARDGSSATFAGVNSDGVTNPACRWQTAAATFSGLVLIGVEMDWEYSFVGSSNTNSSATIFWQVTAGVTLESKILVNNGIHTRSTDVFYLAPGNRQLRGGLTYLTAKNTGPVFGTTTFLIYELRFIFVPRFRTIRIEG